MHWLKAGSLTQHNATLCSAESLKSGMVSQACDKVSEGLYVCVSGENLLSSHLPHQSQGQQSWLIFLPWHCDFLFLLPLLHWRTPRLSWTHLENPGQLPLLRSTVGDFHVLSASTPLYCVTGHSRRIPGLGHLAGHHSVKPQQHSGTYLMCRPLAPILGSLLNKTPHPQPAFLCDECIVTVLPIVMVLFCRWGSLPSSSK